MARLVICEKPSVAADVAKAFASTHKFERTEWGFSSTDLWVAAAAGHLVAELTPEGYDEKYKNWSYEDLPIIPEVFKYQPRDARAAQRLRTLASLCNDAAVTEVINACDAGREGELIFKLIAQFARCSKPIYRAWFSSMTTTAIVDAFSKLRPDREMQPLEAAARCRAEADWIVGMNATRAATVTLGGGRTLLSLGRVQTPTLALLVQRDLLIENFVPEDYFVLRGDFTAPAGAGLPSRKFSGWWRSAREGEFVDKVPNRAVLDSIAAAVERAGVGRIDAVEVKPEAVAPPKLFDLTDLQREANKRFGMTATRTLAAAQACYEEHKVLSYPRTDSRYLPSDMEPMVAQLVRRVRASDPSYVAAADAVLANVDAKRLIDDTKISDHHALVPTDAAHDLSALSEDQRKVYDLVARRLLAALLPAQQLERTVVWVAVDTPDTVWFRASGRRELDPGWRLAWPEAAKKAKKAATTSDDDSDETTDEQDDGELPELRTGERPAVDKAEVVARQTKPPGYFNEASLLASMASAGKLVEDDDVAEAMKDSGLGTPATRASIIERLVTVEYVARQGRQLRATDKGRGVILALGDHLLTRPDLTGNWEKRLRHLERSDPSTVRDQRHSFDTDVKTFAREAVAGFEGMDPSKLRAGRRVLAKCPMPECEGEIIEGRKGWGCSSWKSKEDTGCGFVFWKEQSGKKVSEKQLLAFVAKVASGEATVATRGPRIVLGPCPRCDGEVVERPSSWGCNSWKSQKETGCGYVLWKKNPDGTMLTEEEAKTLLAAGQSNERQHEVFAPCPVCDGSIVERAKFYGCTSWKSPKQTGCGVVVWKLRQGVPVLEDEIRAELARQGAEGPPVKSKTTKSSKPRAKK